MRKKKLCFARRLCRSSLARFTSCMMARPNSLPTWLNTWLLASTAICVWDAMFVLNRPQSFNWSIYSGYSIYMEVDKGYGDIEDGFVIAQSWINLVECTLNVMAVTSSDPNNSYLLAFSTSLMTLSKTVLYLLVDLCQNMKFTGHNNWPTYLLLFIILNGIWIFVPSLAVKHCANIIMKRMGSPGKRNE